MYIGDISSVSASPEHKVGSVIAKSLCPPIVSIPYATSRNSASFFALFTFALVGFVGLAPAASLNICFIGACFSKKPVMIKGDNYSLLNIYIYLILPS